MGPRPCMDFEELLTLQDVLDQQLIHGEVSWAQYEREWIQLLAAAGYTPREYEQGIDRRWDYIEKLHNCTRRRLLH